MSVRALLASVAAVAAGAAAPTRPGPAPRFDEWRIVGPGGGGTTRRPTISPHDPRRVVEACDMTGAYITHDGGESWRMFHLGDGVSAFAFDPLDPAVIYAGTSGIWRSEDAGRTWRLVFPDPARTVERAWGDHADPVLETSDPAYPARPRGVAVETIAVDRRDSRQVVAALSSASLFRGGDRPALLVRSEDGGRTWSRLRELKPQRILALWLEGSSLLAVGEDGAGEGGAGGWEHRPGPGRRLVSAAIGRHGNGLVIHGTSATSWEGQRLAGGVVVSTDRGRTWSSGNATLVEGLWQPGTGEAPQLGPIAASAAHGRTAYVGFRGLRLGEGPAGLYNGVARTTDGGRRWTIVHRESDRPSPTLDGSWVEGRARAANQDIWFDAPYDLGAAPGDPSVCYVTDLFRTYRTLDGGRTWAQVHAARVGEDRWTSRGLDVTTAYGVHFDPFDPARLIISYTDIGAFRSEDGGESWTGATEGIPDEWRNTTYWLAFDPEERDLLWGAFSGTHDLPRPKMWRRQDPAAYRGGIAVSRDGGRTWRPSNRGLPESAFTHVLVDPRSPRGARTLYATAFGRGVYKSTDGGATWSARNEGLEGRQPLAWRLTQARDGRLYLVVARRSEDGSIGGPGDGALYTSADGAEHWTWMALPSGTNGPAALTVDPKDDRRLYLSAWGRANPGGDTGGGVFLSTDGGSTWRSVLGAGQHVYDVTADPRLPGLLYACGFDQAAWRSLDAGETWTRLRGYNFKWGHRVNLDPSDPGRVWITTFGGSVWRGPAAGDPSAPEDVVR